MNNKLSYNSSFKVSGHSVKSFSESPDSFADVRPISTTGTTCDAFEARWQSRHVFIKRLKPQHSSNPVYRTAFGKEYELGASLKHQSLPLYLHFSGDTIIMEFVDGKNLYELLHNNDPWLHKDNNIEKLITQLLNVLDYLHSRNVIHCDIKEDNLMVTNDTRNLMLIDLDKGYTASLDSTPGNPSNFALEKECCSNRQMDIRGVGNIAKRLAKFVQTGNLKHRLSELILATTDSATTIPDLIEIWNEPERMGNSTTAKTRIQRSFIGWSFGLLIITAVLIVIWSYWNGNDSTENYSVEQQNPEQKEYLTEASELEPSVLNEEQDITKSVSQQFQWEPLITEELMPLTGLLNEVEAKLYDNTLAPDSVGNIVMMISSEMTAFNNAIIKRVKSYNPTLGTDEILVTLYETKKMKEMVARRDSLLKRILTFQESAQSRDNFY